MRIDLNGQAGVVTGAAGGIGQAIASNLVEAGARVLLVDREAAVFSIAERLGATGMPADLTEAESTLAILNEVLEAFGRPS